MKKTLTFVFKKRFFIILFIVGCCIFFIGSSIFSAFFLIKKQNLNRFYEVTKNDPLFYDPTTNEQFLRQSIRRMRDLDNRIIENDQTYRKQSVGLYQDVFPAQWRLWPDDFLQMLPVIQDTTAQFSKAPNEQEAKKLLREYDQAISGYRTAIDANIRAMENIFAKMPAVKTKKILFLGSATTPAIVYNDFLLIKKNADALQKEVDQRRKCLYNGICIFSPKKDTMDNTTGVFIPFDPLPLQILGIDKNQVDIAGPYWVSTGCFGYNQDKKKYTYPFYIKVRKGTKNHVFLKPIMTNTQYYRDYRKISLEPFAKKYLKQGIIIRSHPEVNDYLCTDLRYIPELFSQYLNAGKVVKDQNSYASPFATLPYLIQHTLSFSNLLVYYPDSTKKSFDPLYLLINRSAYSLYFGTFSSRVWRIAQQPTFLLTENFNDALNQQGFVTYKDLVNQEFSDKEITRFAQEPHIDTIYSEDSGQ